MKKVFFALLLCGTLFANRAPEEGITPRAQPCVKNGVAEIYLLADFLYWKVTQDGLGYAQRGTSQPVLRRGTVYQPRFKGKPGLRVGLGLNLAHDGWDLLLTYTWLNVSADGRTSNTDAEPLWKSGESSFLAGGLTRAVTDWNIHFHIFDLEWGRHYYISRFLTLRPFFGFKGFFSGQDNCISYRGFVDQNRTQAGTNRVFLEEDTWGFGIRLGLNTAWFFAENWSAFANFALSEAWTKFDVERKDRGNGATILHLHYDRYTMTPILELGVGLRWDIWWNEDSYHASIQAGWEEQMWWDFNRFYSVNLPDSSLGNLSMQGLTARFRFDF